MVWKVIFCKGFLLKFTFGTTFCGVEGEFLPSTPLFVVSKVNFSHWNHNSGCPSRTFLSAPNISTGTEIVGVWKAKKRNTLTLKFLYGIVLLRQAYQIWRLTFISLRSHYMSWKLHYLTWKVGRYSLISVVSTL